MSQMGIITIINGKPHDFIRGHHHSYQMNDWDSAFPETIPRGESASKTIWFENPWVGDKKDDAGEQIYTLDGTTSSFEIRGRSPVDGVHLQLLTTNLLKDAQSLETSLGWQDSSALEISELYLWIAGQDDAYIMRHWWRDEQA